MDKQQLNVRRKEITKTLNGVFWVVLVSSVPIIPVFNLNFTIPVVYKISRLAHPIFGTIMVVLIFMHLK